MDIGTLWLQIQHGILRALYWILKSFAELSKLIINCIRALAGLGTYSYNGTTIKADDYSQGDILLNLIQEETLQNVFISLFALAIVLLFVVTFIAVIKSEWGEFGTGKEVNNKYKVISASVRALINFLAVPVVSILGLIVGNALLKALDGATASQSQEGIVNVVMYSLTADALFADDSTDSVGQKIILANNTTDTENKTCGVYYLFVGAGDKGIDTAAIHEAFRDEITVEAKNFSGGVVFVNPDGTYIDSANSLTEQAKNGTLTFSYYNIDMMEYFFAFKNIHFVMGFLVLYLLLKFMLSISFGLVKRIFALAILIIISPPVVAITPLRPEALKEWRKYFLQYAVIAYGYIVGLNLFFMLVPYVQNIYLVDNGGLIDRYIGLLFVVGGMSVVQDLGEMINKIIGGGNLWSESMGKDGSMWKKPMKTVGQGAGNIVGAPIKTVASGIEIGRAMRYGGFNAGMQEFGHRMGNVGRTIADNTFIGDVVGRDAHGHADANYLRNNLGLNEAGRMAQGIFNTRETEDSISAARGNINHTLNNVSNSLAQNATNLEATDWAQRLHSTDDSIRTATEAQERRFHELSERDDLTDEERNELSTISADRQSYTDLETERTNLTNQQTTLNNEMDALNRVRADQNGQIVASNRRLDQGAQQQQVADAQAAIAHAAGRNSAEQDQIRAMGESINALRASAGDRDNYATEELRNQLTSDLNRQEDQLRELRNTVQDTRAIERMQHQIEEIQRLITRMSR